MLESLFPGLGGISFASEGTCCCYCDASDPKKDDTKEDYDIENPE